MVKVRLPRRKSPVEEQAVQKKKKVNFKYQIDCSRPVEVGILQTDDFETCLKSKIKIHGRVRATDQRRYMKFERQKYKLTVQSEIPITKRYLEYLTKKYLKKNNLSDRLRVVSPSKDLYELKYYQIDKEEEEDEKELVE